MKKTIYLIVLTLITAACILWRVFSGFGGIFNTRIFGNHESMGDAATVESERLDDFTKIQMDVNVSDIDIETGDGYSISYTAPQKLIPKYKVDNGTLVVTQTDDINIFGINNISTKMVITVPENVMLEDVDISSSVGDVTIQRINTQHFTCDADVGDMKITGANLGNCDMDADTGDIRLQETSFEDIEITSDVGDVEVSATNEKENYNLDLSTDVGDVTVDGDHKASEYVTEGNAAYDMDISSSVGDVKVSFE